VPIVPGAEQPRAAVPIVQKAFEHLAARVVQIVVPASPERREHLAVFRRLVAERQVVLHRGSFDKAHLTIGGIVASALEHECVQVLDRHVLISSWSPACGYSSTA